MDSGLTQRWSRRQSSWRHRSEGGFDRARYEVAELPDDRTAKAFVEANHYSGSFPAARFRYGLYERGGALVGVAVLGVPARERVLTKPFPGLVPYAESLVLTRFVLLDEVPYNAESWTLARVFELARRRGVKGVLAFSDPVPRKRADGTLVMPGHVGHIYQVSNAVYLGRATPRSLTLLPDGTVFDDRAQQKIRAQDQGHEYAEQTLAALGAKPLRPGDNPAAWLRAALAAVGATGYRHPGNHTYAFSLERPRRLYAIAAGLLGQLPQHALYPKRRDPAPWRTA
jgi:hypothetical protein